MIRCTNCVLPQTYPGITFDEQGVCNYCRAHQPRTLRGEAALAEIVDRYRSRDGGYDCIVGLSGGRDSSYTLWYATTQLHLKVLAYTVDNGFIPEQTKANIEHMTKLLGVDHVVDRHRHTERCIKHFVRSWMRKPSAAMLSSMCTGCRLGMILGFLTAARRWQTPLLLTGGGEPESSFATRLLTARPDEDTGALLLAGYARELLRDPAYLWSPVFLGTAVAEYVCCFSSFPTMRRLIYPTQKYVPLFEYVAWNEGTIVSVIENELAWENYAVSKSTWRSDCRIGLLKNYLYKKTVSFDKHEELMSGMIREGMLTREKAQSRLASETELPEEFVAEFLAELGLDYRDLQAALAQVEGNGHP